MSSPATSRLVINNGTPVSSAISESLSWASEAYFCVAYARYGAFEILRPELEGFLRRGGKLRAIFDVERVVTDPSIIEEIATIPGDSECRVIYRRQDDPVSEEYDISGLFHPKLYLFQKGTRTRILVGSSNFTQGGLERNVEANVAIDGETTDKLWPEATAYFQVQWNAREAINPEESNFIERYKERWLTHHRLRRSLERRLVKVRSAVEGIFDEARLELHSKLNAPLCYFLGIIAGGGTRAELGRRLITIRYHRGPMNRGTSDEGVICAPGISTIRLRQSDAIKKDVESIRESLVQLFAKADPGSTVEVRKLSDYDYKIAIQFVETSKMWKTVQEFVRTTTASNGRLVPKIPSGIIAGERKHLAKSFIQGYADVRSRISVTDREGVRGPLRISVSVSTYAGKFGREMKQLMENTFGMKIGLAEGSRRGRETMSRRSPLGWTFQGL